MKEGADMLAEKETEVEELRERLCVLLESRGELQQLKELLASLEEESGDREGEGDNQGGRRRDYEDEVEENEDDDEEDDEDNASKDNVRGSDDVKVTSQGREGSSIIYKDGTGHVTLSCEPAAPAIPLEVDDRGIQRGGGVMENQDHSFAAVVSPPSSSSVPSNPPEQKGPYSYPVHDDVANTIPSPSKHSSASEGPAIAFMDKHVSAPVSVPVPVFVPVSLEGISASTLSALLTPPKKQTTAPASSPAPSSSSHPLDTRTQNREGSPCEGKGKSNSRWHTRELL